MLHINILETAAAYSAVKIYCKHLQNTTIHLKLDNTATMVSLNKQKGANITVCNIIKKIWEFCMDRNLWIFASNIPSKGNKTADKESRKLRHSLEWALHQWVFDKIVQKFCLPDVDLLASRANFKIKPYISYYPDPEASSVNAFASKWSGRKFYAFPPFSIIARIISKIDKEQANGILIVPIFTTQAWFSRLLRLLLEKPLLLPDTNRALFFPYSTKDKPMMVKAKLMACHVSGNLLRNREFLKKLQKSLCVLGDQELNPSTKAISNNGTCFAINGVSVTKSHCSHILCFLHELFKRNLGYSAINTARSSLSSFLEIDGKPAGQHHLLS